MSGKNFYSQINMLVDPTEPNHVTRLRDVMDLVDGKTKSPVRVISLANLAGSYDGTGKTFTATSNGAITLDGVTLAVDDRILVNGQTDKTVNGIYAVTDTGDGSSPFVLTRDTDMDASDEIIEGMRIFISEGSVYAGTVWKLQGTGPFTLDTSNIEFVQDIVKYREIMEKVFDLAGDGSETEFSFTHGFGTKNVTVEVYDAATGETVEPLVVRNSVSDINVVTGIAVEAGVVLKVIVRAVLNPS
jgi:hypothetical protein